MTSIDRCIVRPYEPCSFGWFAFSLSNVIRSVSNHFRNETILQTWWILRTLWFNCAKITNTWLLCVWNVCSPICSHYVGYKYRRAFKDITINVKMINLCCNNITDHTPSRSLLKQRCLDSWRQAATKHDLGNTEKCVKRALNRSCVHDPVDKPYVHAHAHHRQYTLRVTMLRMDPTPATGKSVIS